MQKVYLLLRSNKQTGPYTLEELLQLNLKPFDLVWVEGRTAAWQYPFEIPALKPYVPETPQAEAPFQPIATSAMEEKSVETPIANPQKTEIPKRVFVSIPKTHVQAGGQKNNVPPADRQHEAYMPQPQQAPKKEEVKETGSYTASFEPHASQKPVGEEPLHTNYSRSLNEVEENYTNWVYQKKTKKKSSVQPKDLVMATLILAVIGGGYYVMSKPSVANSVLPASKITTKSGPQAVENTQPVSEQKQEELPTEQKPISDPEVNRANRTENTKLKNPVSVSKKQTSSSVPPVQNSMPVEKTSNIPDDNKDVVSGEPEIKQQPKVENAPEKKKKFGEVIKGIFSKKEKTEESKNNDVVLEDPKPADNRKATRRESNDHSSQENPSNEKQEEVNAASLAEQVDISSNASDNWMMGIKNLKITLRNRSNVTIQTASVTVNYYDENNQLLEKKLVYFSNIAPKARATVAAPDHKWADHIEFKLTTVSAKEDRYASH